MTMLPQKLTLELLGEIGIAWAQLMVETSHYLHKPIDARCSVEGYALRLEGVGRIGCLLFGRPQATRCKGWYGSVADVETGRCEITRWQVLNLARVWLHPSVQRGGEYYGPKWLPGFTDRHGEWRSTLASRVIREALTRIGFDYLRRRPPCFLDEPYMIEWVLSYCDESRHKGTIYEAAGFEKYRVNDDGIATWRRQVPMLNWKQNREIRKIAEQSLRSRRYRSQRAVEGAEQLELAL